MELYNVEATIMEHDAKNKNVCLREESLRTSCSGWATGFLSLVVPMDPYTSPPCWGRMNELESKENQLTPPSDYYICLIYSDDGEPTMKSWPLIANKAGVCSTRTGDCNDKSCGHSRHS